MKNQLSCLHIGNGRLLAPALSLLAAAAIGLMAVPTQASSPGSDNAASSAYSGGWTNGSGSGTVFIPWSLNPTSSGSGQGFFIGDSTKNGSGNGGTDINTNGDAWGFYSNNGNTTAAERKFTSGGLIISQQVSVLFDNGYVTSGGPSVGVGLNGTDDTPRVEFFFSGGDNQYRIHDNSSTTRSTSISWTQTGLGLLFTMTGTNSYSLTVSNLNNASVSSFTGTLAGLSNAPIDRLRFWNFNAGSGSTFDAYGNEISLNCNSNPTTSAANNGPICVGSTLNLTATGDSVDSYSWTGPASYSSTNQDPSISNVTTNMGGSYSVTRTKNGCTSPSSSTTVSINTTPSISASNGGPVCVGSTLKLFGVGSGSGSYSWTGPASFTSSSQNPTITNVQTNEAGSYCVSVTLGGCSSTQYCTTASVETSNTVASANTPVCSGSTLDLFSTGVSGDSFSWTGPNSFSSSAQNPTIANVTTNATGAYKVIRTGSPCGTSATGTVSVTINQTPTTSASNNGPVCSGQTLTLSATGNASDSYSWTGPNSFTSTNQNPSIAGATTAASGTYSVTRTVNGCGSAVSNTTATVNAPPPCGVTGEATVGSETAHTYTAPSESGLTYSWSITGNGSIIGSAASQSVNIDAGSVGSFVLNLTVGGIAGCSNSSCVQTVTVSACSISGPASVHPLRSGYTYTAWDGASNYVWTVCGSASISSSSANTATVTSATSGSFTLSVSYIDVTGSTQTCSQIVSINSSAISALTQHYNNSRTGANLQEYVLTPSNVNSNQFGKLFTYSVDGAVFAQPLYVDSLVTSNGTHDVVYIATQNDSVYAFDADTLSNALWQVSLGQAVPDANIFGCEDISNQVGITSTPVINTNNNTIYVECLKETVSSGTTNYFQYLHALDLVTGAEKFGGPVQISATISNGTFDALHNLQRPGLLLLNTRIYLAFGSHCDTENYNGWLMSYNATNLLQVSVFCTTPDDSAGEGAIWNCGAGPAADTNGNVYVITANGDFNANTAGPDYGDSYIKFSTSGGTLTISDWFTPHDQANLSANDLDLGSGGPLLVPGTQLMIGVGKTGAMYLVNVNNMGHYATGEDTNIVQAFICTPGTDTIGQGPVYWEGGAGGTNQYLFLSAGNGNTEVFSFNGSTVNTNPLAQGSITQGDRAGGISLSADGTTNGILWVVNDDNNGTFRAYDAANMPNVLWTSQQNASRDAMGLLVKFGSPIVANSKVYLPVFNNQVIVYGLLSPSVGNPTPSAVITAGPACRSSSGNAASVPNAGSATYTWTVNNGATITAGSNTQSIVYSVGTSSPVTITVAVSNQCGTASSNTSVTVDTPPSITVQPSPLISTNHVGQTITNTVTATGTAITYQWYKTGWATNGWSFDTTTNDTTQNGFFTGSSSTVFTPGIDVSGLSWGLYANNGQTVDAIRSFSVAMATGQTFQIAMDNGFVTSGASVGFGLRTATATNRFEFYFLGGSTDYFIHDSRGLGQDSGVGWSTAGLQLSFTLTAADSYKFVIVSGTTTNTVTGTLAGVAGSAITNLRLFNFNSGSGTSFDLYFNSLNWLNTVDTAADPAYAGGWLAGTDGGNTALSGATSATYTKSNCGLNDAGAYDVVVGSPSCASVTSSTVVQTVISP